MSEMINRYENSDAGEMYLRDFLAGLAMQGILAGSHGNDVGVDLVAEMACDLADALMARLQATRPPLFRKEG